jgi:DNA (cytosine-5)-methyltransferase 1
VPDKPKASVGKCVYATGAGQRILGERAGGVYLNGLDLFSGIGGITKALAGYVRPVAYCENERYAQAVLLSRMWAGDLPNAPIWDDVRTLRGEDLAVKPDIIYGGFPCQDISVAGRGAGLAGERSGLFFEIARLVGEIRPAFCFLENVPAITSRGGWEVVGAFAALGYDCRWDMLSAYDVGAPHRRDRWWLLAYTVPTGKWGGSWKDETKKYAMAHTNGKGRPESRRTRTGRTEFSDGSGWPVEPAVGGTFDGLSRRMDRLKGLGNSVVPAQAREAFERLMGVRRWKIKQIIYPP